MQTEKIARGSALTAPCRSTNNTMTTRLLHLIGLKPPALPRATRTSVEGPAGRRSSPSAHPNSCLSLRRPSSGLPGAMPRPLRRAGPVLLQNVLFQSHARSATPEAARQGRGGRRDITPRAEGEGRGYALFLEPDGRTKATNGPSEPSRLDPLAFLYRDRFPPSDLSGHPSRTSALLCPHHVRLALLRPSGSPLQLDPSPRLRPGLSVPTSVIDSSHLP